MPIAHPNALFPKMSIALPIIGGPYISPIDKKKIKLALAETRT